MEKLVLRKKLVHARSNYIDKCRREGENMGPASLLKTVYEEDTPFDALTLEYEQTLNGEKSSLFSLAYKVRENCALVLDAHITLYRLSRRTDEPAESMVPWEYFSNSIYLGDTWWFEDKEILHDLEEMNSVDFLIKYKRI